MNLSDKRLKLLRIVAWIEGLSFLVLLFIAMPLKYFADQPGAVRSVGMVHGLLFALFVLYAVQAKVEYRWSGGHLLRLIGTAFVPFGMVMFDRMIREERG